MKADMIDFNKTKSFKIGKAFNIPIKIHWSFIFLALLFYQAVGIFGVIAFSFIVVAHEFGHALVAKKYGIHTEDIILHGLGGVARLVGYMPTPNQEILICGAGPVVNLGLATLGIPFMFIPQTAPFASYWIAFNIVLGIFNLFPIFPMDGGRILRGFIRKFKPDLLKSTKISIIIGNIIAVGLIPVFILNGMFLALFVVVIISAAGWMEYKSLKKVLGKDFLLC